MFFLFHYKKNGLPHGLAKLHQFLLEDIISYFEKGRSTKKRIKEIRKSIKDAVRFARKKKIYPSLKTKRAVELMEEIYEEMEITHKVLKEAALEMENLLKEVKEERVINIHSIVTEAQEWFKEKEIENGIKLLLKANNELNEKVLIKTRKKILAGYDSEIRKIKYEIEENGRSEKKRKNTRFFSMSVPFNEYTSYKLAKNFFESFSEVLSMIGKNNFFQRLKPENQN